MFSGSGPNFIGFDAAGKGDHSGDPLVDDLIRKSRIERDNNKRKQILIDMQKYIGEQMYIVRAPAGATTSTWPGRHCATTTTSAAARTGAPKRCPTTGSTTRQKPNKS